MRYFLDTMGDFGDILGVCLGFLICLGAYYYCFLGMFLVSVPSNSRAPDVFLVSFLRGVVSIEEMLGVLRCLCLLYSVIIP